MTASPESDLRKVGTIWMLNLNEPISAVQPRVQAGFRRAGSEWATILSAMRAGNSCTELSKRFQTGRQCYTAWVGDQLAAYGWISFEDEYIGELNLSIKLLPGEVYIWDCATAPRFRGNHLYSALLVYMLEALHDQQVCRAWIGADLENVASQKGMRRAGFHHVADLWIRHPSLARQFLVLGQPKVPENLVDEARRAFLGNQDKVWRSASPAVLQG